jgi:hypothetical protein
LFVTRISHIYSVQYYLVSHNRGRSWDVLPEDRGGIAVVTDLLCVGRSERIGNVLSGNNAVLSEAVVAELFPHYHPDFSCTHITRPQVAVCPCNNIPCITKLRKNPSSYFVTDPCISGQLQAVNTAFTFNAVSNVTHI